MIKRVECVSKDIFAQHLFQDIPQKDACSGVETSEVKAISV